MDNHNRITREILLYSLILLAALALRLLLLGRTPLVDQEASLAFQAWEASRGAGITLGSQVSYLAVSSGLFRLFGGGDFQARLWPALAGSLLVLVPFLLRGRMGRIPALVLAAGLAIDPGLVAVSRIAGSPMPALVFLALSLAVFDLKQLPWSGFLLFLALISGPAAWLGLVLVGLTALIGNWLGIIDLRPYFRERMELLKRAGSSPGLRWEDLFLPGLLILAIGSFFFTRLQGLSAWLGSLPEFLGSWLNLPGLRSPEVLIHLAVSSPLTLIFGGLGFYNSWREDDSLGKVCSIGFGLGLFLLLVYPGREPADLIWLALPLWTAGAREIVRHLRQAEGSWPVYVLAGMLAVLIGLNWLTLIGMVFQAGNQRAVLLQAGLLAASLALAVLAMMIIASEKGWAAARKGLVLGAGSMLLLYTLSAMVQGAYLRAGDPRSLWTDGAGYGQVDLLRDTISGISLAQTGQKDSLEGIVVNGSDTVRWYLRELKEFSYVSAVYSEILPPIIITSDDDQYLVSQQAYRGQDFVIRSWPGWPGLIPQDWISWIAFRDGPLVYQKVILWVRGDILAGDE